MASPFISEQSVLGASPEATDLERQRKIAELLMTQGMEQPQGQVTVQAAPQVQQSVTTGGWGKATVVSQ